MLVLGVDPGLTRCGLGLVEGAAGRPLVLRHVEVVTTPSTQPLADRLLHLSSRIRDLLSDQPADVVAVERMFSQHNLHTVMGTAQASAAAVLAAAEAHVVHDHRRDEVVQICEVDDRHAAPYLPILGVSQMPLELTPCLRIPRYVVWVNDGARTSMRVSLQETNQRSSVPPRTTLLVGRRLRIPSRGW